MVWKNHFVVEYKFIKASSLFIMSKFLVKDNKVPAASREIVSSVSLTFFVWDNRRGITS